MNTDREKDAEPIPPGELNLWQKRQATLLYHFASLEYLKGLKYRIDALIKGADLTLDTALAQGRDRFIVNERWGARDTAANWSTYGFPALVDFQQTTAKAIAKRAFEEYGITDARNCAGHLRELSMQWATEEEEKRFNDSFEAVYNYASYIDRIVQRPLMANDGVFFNIWTGHESEFPSLRTPRHAALFPRLPSYRVRTDVVAETGKKPPRTGVYAPQNDPYGALQFGWTTGGWDGSLDDCVTFNELGLKAIEAVGRDSIWNKSAELLAFVKKNYGADFKTYMRESRGKRFKPEHLDDPSWAIVFLSEFGFFRRPCKWYFIEKINDEYESEDDAEPIAKTTARERVPAGDRCPQSGWWYTPAKRDSRRHFTADEIFPAIKGSDYGATFWQWSPDQTSSK